MRYFSINLYITTEFKHTVMKRTFLLLSSAVLLSSCGATMRTMSGATSNQLIKQVSVEQGCPKDEIKVLDKQQAAGNATYALDVCGKRMVYKQVGSVFMESSKSPL